MELFFQMLYGTEQQGWVPVVTYPPRERRGVKTIEDWKAMSLNAYEWFQWPQQADQLVAYCHSKRAEDVYVTVGLCSAKNNRKESIMPLNVIHCDADNAAPHRFLAEPSLSVESSPGRWQLYWQLKEAVAVAKAEPLAKKIAYSQIAHGADTGWNANKLMRVPGTTNTKPGYPKKYKITSTPGGRVYTYKELKKAFAGVLDASVPAAQDLPMPTVRIEKSDVLQRMPGGGEAMDFFFRKAEKDADNDKMRSRYKAIWNLACAGFHNGLHRDEVYWLCYHSVNNKYKEDGRSDTELWRDVLKAENRVEEDKIVFVNDDPEDAPIILDSPPGVQLLKDGERQRVLENTFIERYLAWASTKTLADHKYHRANAITILSTILSEFGYGVPKHGTLGLELWFMVLGVTTRSYKTTAAKLMLRFIEAAGKDREYPYELESDTTPESLGESLANRGEISSLYHVDEAHATIGDAKGGKGYMAGLIPLLTKLYDGKVPGVSRIGRANTKQSKTHFTLSMLGVPGKMTETLTREDFASGFLARFIFVLGSPAPRDRDSRWMDQAPEDAKPDTDPEFANMLFWAAHLVAIWKKKIKDSRYAEDGRMPIRVCDEAWARWNQLVLDLDQIAADSEDTEAVMPTAERTTVAAHKLACLLAMAEGEEVVSMEHMLTAISYAEQWYDTMTQMSQLVFASQWQRQVNELIEWVRASKDRRSYAAAYKKFSNYKPKEFEDMVQTALQTGQLIMELKPGINGQSRFLKAAK